MIGELAEHYQVRQLTAVLKRNNHRSMRFLERLGFSGAPSELNTGIEPDETMMYRRIA
jgi:RimJ/RimL family protein N-acetyltransferase